MHGEGVLRMRRSEYQGTFENGAMSGVGMRKWADGCVLDSSSLVSSTARACGSPPRVSSTRAPSRNLREGHGTFLTSSGDRYEGEFHAHHMAGEGSMAYTDGSKYEGEWVKSQRAGNGRQEWPAGDEYEGVWVADKPHGSGLLKHPDGYARDGDWVEGEPTTTASRVVLAPWTPPPTDLVLSDLVVASPAPGEEAATPAAEGGEGEGEGAAAAAAAAPDLRSLSLRVSVAGLDDDAAPISATSALVAVDSPMTACAPADALCLALPEGLARPLTLRFALCDAEGVVVAEAAEQVLAHDAADRLVGALTAVGLAAPSDDSKDGGTAVATLHAVRGGGVATAARPGGYGGADGRGGGCGGARGGASRRRLRAAARVACACAPSSSPPRLRTRWPRRSRRRRPRARAARVRSRSQSRRGRRSSCTLSRAGGRALRVTLTLPDDVAQQRIEAAEAAHAQAVADWEAAQAEAAVAHAEARQRARRAKAVARRRRRRRGAPPPAPPPPASEWDLGTILTVDGRWLARGLVVPDDVPTGPATLHVSEATPPVSLFTLPALAPLELSVSLLEKPPPPPEDGEEPPPPPAAKGKK